jgi:hypothetical protein
MVINLSDSDIQLLREYPTLNHDSEKNVINGILPFDLKFGENGEQIIDEYQIEIDLNNVSSFGVPIVKETNNRILNIARQKNISPADVHVNYDGTMCIIIPPKEKEKYPNGFDLKELLMHLQEHLYWVSYLEKYDKTPWQAYGHGEEGYLDLYIENRGKYGESVKKYFGCNSRPEFRRKLKELSKKYHKII